MKTITKLALSVAALGMVAIPVLAQENNQNNPPPAPPGAEQPSPDDNPDDNGGWWGWARGKGGCDHDGRGGGHHRGGRHGGWGDGAGRGPDGDGPGMHRMMSVIDGNSDGVISDDEAASRVEGMFLAMDADANGEVTKEEFMAVRMGPGGHRGRNKDNDRMAAMQKAKDDRFAAMDNDKDGKVTKEQFLSAGKARFQAADADKDGKVTPWEFRATRQN